LEWGWFGVLVPARGSGDGGNDGVAGDGGQVGQEALERVDGLGIWGSLGAGFGFRGAGGLFGGHRVGSGGCGFLVVKEHGLENRAHVPFHVIGEHAQEHMGSHAVGVAVVDGAHLEIDGFDAAERVLHEAEVLVALDDVGGFKALML